MTSPFLFRPFTNPKGFTLPFMMVIAVVGSLTTLYLDQILTHGRGMTTRRDQLINYEVFVENFKHVMENPEACGKILGGQRINMGKGARTLLGPVDANSTTPLGLLWNDPHRSFEMSHLEIEILSDSPVNHMRVYNPADFKVSGGVNPPAFMTYPARFMIHPKEVRTSLAKETDPYYIDLYKMEFEEVNPLHKNRLDIRIFVNVDANQQIQNCYGYRSQAAICAASGGVYDFNGLDQDFPHIKCKPYKRCLSSQKGLVNHPSLCPPPYNYKDQQGKLLFANHMGKVNGVDQYLCLWCHPFHETLVTTGDVPSSAFENLKQQLISLLDRTYLLMNTGVPPTDPSVTPLALEWESLGSLVLGNSEELGLSVSSLDQFAESLKTNYGLVVEDRLINFMEQALGF